MPETFGRYELATLLGHGGMAEVFRATQQSGTGASKQLVVKRILPGMSQHSEFRSMFLDEGRLTTQLSHGNVVQVFEAGEVDGQLFLAMEWVDGVGLDKVLQHARARQVRLPPVVAVMIAIEALKGLHHAHTRVDAEGRLLRIVHRDISPDNLLVSFEGQVKVNDFGIAKAALEGRAETQSGIFKGKLAYGAPEQIRGEKVDPRADVFSMGVVLHEMLSGNNPIGQKAVELALTGAPLPRIGTFFVGEELPEIVARATASRPDERYPSALAFQQALTGWMLPRAGLHATTGIASLMTWLFPAETGARGLAQQLDTDTVRWLESNPLEPEPVAAAPLDPTAVSGERQAHKPLATPAAYPVPAAPTEVQPLPGTPRPPGPRAVLRLAVVGLLAGGGLSAAVLGGSKYLSDRGDAATLQRARQDFERRDLSGTRAELEPLLAGPSPLPAAQVLLADVEYETRPSTAMSHLAQVFDDATRQHRPPDPATVANLFQAAKSTKHFSHEVDALAARYAKVRSVPADLVDAALYAYSRGDLKAARGLLPCLTGACDDDWFREQLELEKAARTSLNLADELIATGELEQARNPLLDSAATLYQGARRDRLLDALAAAQPKTLLSRVRTVLVQRDWAGARKLIDDCRAGPRCEGADEAQEMVEDEEAYDRDATLAENALAAHRPKLAREYLDKTPHTVVQDQRAEALWRRYQKALDEPKAADCVGPTMSYFHDGHYKVARDMLKSCTELYPDPHAWHLLADCYVHLDQYSEAILPYRRYIAYAASRDDDWKEVRAHLTGIAHKTKDPAAAKAALLLTEIPPVTARFLSK